MTENIGLWTCFILSATLVASVAMAQDGENVCAADRKKFCGSAQEMGAVFKCMGDHFDELSAECQAAITAVRSQIEAKKKDGAPAGGGGAVRKACAAEVEKLCKEMIGKPKKMAVCLSEHEAELSDGCKAALKKRMQASE